MLRAATKTFRKVEGVEQSLKRYQAGIGSKGLIFELKLGYLPSRRLNFVS